MLIPAVKFSLWIAILNIKEGSGERRDLSMVNFSSKKQVFLFLLKKTNQTKQ